MVKEIKDSEWRVAITPAGVRALTERGHEVYIEAGAGVSSGICDTEYEAQGAKIVDDAAKLWDMAELLLKVKEPVGKEFEYLHENLTLFTYLHLAAAPELTEYLSAGRSTPSATRQYNWIPAHCPFLRP